MSTTATSSRAASTKTAASHAASHHTASTEDTDLETPEPDDSAREQVWNSIQNQLTGNEKRLSRHILVNLGLTGLPDSNPYSVGTDGFAGIPVELIYSNSTVLNLLAQELKERGPSTFKPHHIVDIVYPALDLLGDEREIRMLHEPADAASRYQPTPLVRSEAVCQNARRETAEASAFSTLYEVYPRPSEPKRTGNLFEDVKNCTQYLGTTELKVVLYYDETEGKGPGRADTRPRLRVRRKTKFILDHKVKEVAKETFFYEDDWEENNTQDYEMPYYYFYTRRGDPSDFPQPWFLDIVRLIAMQDQRAAAHIQYNLYKYATQTYHSMEHAGAKEFLVQDARSMLARYIRCWKPVKLPALENWLKSSYATSRNPFKKERDGEECQICQQLFEPGHRKLVAMPCCGATVDQSCLLLHCYRFEAMSPYPPFDKIPRCYCCAQQLNMDLPTRRSINEAASQNDETSTPWERFERSCRDLDSTHPIKTFYTFNINATVFEGAWNYVLQRSSNENDELQRRIDDCVELDFYQEELLTRIRLLHECPTTIEILWKWLQKEIYNAFLQRFKKLGYNEAVFKRGFEEFTNRVLHRTLMFFMHRRCTCEHMGLHFHSNGPDSLAYYNDRKFVPGDTSTMRNWTWESLCDLAEKDPGPMMNE